MAIETFESWRPQPRTAALLAEAAAILDQAQADGFRLSLRQLYYQLVTSNAIANRQSEYKRLGEIIGRGRLAGFIDWSAIEDRGRVPRIPAAWDGPDDMLRAAAEQYRRDRWADQPYHVEVWVEKDALSGVLAPVCAEEHVRLVAARGYASLSAVYEAALRLREAYSEKDLAVLYLGDHDPSGLDMDRDLFSRLTQLTYELPIQVERIALTRPQIDEHDPPPNPAKLSDSRAGGYIAEHGLESWELDALDYNLLANLVRDAIRSYRDDARWDATLEREDAERESIEEAAANVA